MSGKQKVVRSHDIKVNNSSSERVEEFIYLATPFKESEFYP